MAKISMIAARRMHYGTRRLKAGDYFTATRSEAALFRALRWANDGAAPAARIATLTPAKVIEHVESDLDVLRTEYADRAGKAADRRWGVSRLKTEIEALP
jgi:hypothetical protein